MGKKKSFLKMFSLVLASLLLLVGIAGCSSSKESGGKGGKTKLTIWLWPGMGFEEQIKEYAKENDIEVDIQLSEFADVHSNLTTALAAGSGAPDISAVEVKGIDKVKGTPDHFHNLLDLGAEEVKDNYLDWKWQQALTPDGKHLLGLPTDIGPMAMVYRTDVFAEAGLPTDPEEVTQLIQTWDDFINVGKDIRAKAGKAMIPSAASLYSVMEGQDTQKYWDDKGNLIVETNPQIKKAFDYAAKAVEAKITADVEAFSTEWGAAMEKGDFAVQLAPAWMIGRIKETDTSGKWNIALMPEGSGNWGGSFLTIPKESKNQEEAYKLIKWLLSPEQQLATFKHFGNFPSTPGIYDDAALQDETDDFFSGAHVGKIYAEAAKKVTPVIEGPDSILVEEIMTDAVTRVEKGQEDAEKSWKTAMEELDRQLNR
ncbi:extracellular solute-binding protein [Lederbergia citrea]|uniref:Extracellular solute-binding protein n=1 Tax=Lederbergia citrea TaxID=2833581 RepID=A0A942UQC8_9BACI|nr:extracellular solute-binding protein [Lederbergia citrea]MBS4178458.1 extracellular solute-binding protein [Lederbergia citrea]MBS4205130.1 extracellular solute-binding protein [Lederbergia citrea]MBS4223008.1 extracellular solute-binding protein [Lederbergia citrea]